MNAEEVQEIARLPFVEIGSHSNLHVDLEAATADEAYRELASSKQALEDVLGRAVESFAYPFCRYSPACPPAAERAGYASAVTCGRRGGLRPYELQREAISRMDGRLALELKRRGVYYGLWESAPGRVVRRAARPLRRAMRSARARRGSPG